jgi:4-amino-4-deoxy-L-arabinose transferase-like glycosyltransferase
MTVSPAHRAWLGCGLALAIFCAPLLVGLREPDMRNDESIYSYAVERILDTGDWLTPRAIPGDGPFYEKPPLKFWMVAAGVRAGLLPRDERGMRLLDAIMGGAAFLYVYWIGWRMGGVACGLVALLVLFTLDPLLFDHGLRSNNMESALLLSYCGGVFHFARWRDAAAAPPRRWHALAFAGWFTLGFLTKFVAVVFLPMACVAAFLWGRDGWKQISRWREWIVPAAAAVALIAPWFVYQTVNAGAEFWRVIFGAHIVERFTASLDPAHLRPWHFYFTQTWLELGYAHSQPIAAVGLLALAAAAIRSPPFVVRLVVAWGVLPCAALSIGTSKLIHYAFPFWPPIGLGAGYAFALAARFIDRRIGPVVAGWFARRAPAWSSASSTSRWVRVGLLSVAMVAFAVAAWTAVVGPIGIVAGGKVLFRNGTVLRPLVLACLLAFVAGSTATTTRMVGILVLSLVLPFRSYQDAVRKLGRPDHPLRTLRECMLDLQAAGEQSRGVLVVRASEFAHPYYYYLAVTGPFREVEAYVPGDVIARLDPGTAPVFMHEADYDALVAGLMNPHVRAAEGWPPLDDAAIDRIQRSTWEALKFEGRLYALLPGPFRACRAPMIAGGGVALVPPRTAP